MKQRFLSWVLAFVMVIGLLPMAALADTNESASEPTPLTLDENGQATFTVEGAKAYSDYYFSVDLGEEKTVEVSADMTTEVFGRIDLEGADILWRNFKENGKGAWPHTVTAKELVFIVRSFSDGTISGTVNVEVEQPKLMFRYMSYDRETQTWSESIGNLQDISNFSSVEAGRPTRVRLYYGTSAEAIPVTSASSSNPDIVSITTGTAADGKPFYQLSGIFPGTAAITCTIGDISKTFDFKVNLPDFGFYSAAERNAANYLSSVTLTGTDTDLTKIWFISANKLKINEEDKITVTAGDTDITSTNVKVVDEYTLEITLPIDSFGSVYYIGVKRNTENLIGIKVTQSNNGGDQSSSGNNQPSLPDEPTLSDLPAYAFFGTQARDRNYYLPHVIWRNLREGDGDTNDDNRFIWLVGETGFTEEQKSKITVETSGVEVDVTGKEIPIQCAWFDRGDSTYALRVAIPMPKMTYDIVVKLDGTVLQKVAVEYKTFGNTYTHEQSGLVIGFALQEAGVTTVTPSLLGMGNYKDERPYDNRKTTSIVAATRQTTGGTDAYIVDEDVTSTLQIKRLWLESVNGDASAFSLSPNEYQSVLTNVSNHSIPLYVRGGHIGTSRLCAEVTGKIGEEPFTTTVSAILDVYFTATGVKTYRPDNDTVTALNAYLEELAQTINPHVLDGTIYTIHLGNTSYTGTIVLPEEFQGNNIVHIYGSNNTTIQGGIDLNTACVEQIRNIRFTANDDEKSADGKTRALYGSGVWSLYNCTFYGYDIALDSSDGLINATGGNVFVNNEIASFVDLDDVVPTKYDRNLHRGYWKNNTFINNGTAVQVLSLHRLVPTYHFRIYDSNFINNGTDIDAQCGGTLYMYRNYFGQYQKDKDGHRPHPGKHHADRHNGREHLRLDELLNARTETKLNGILEYTRAKVSTENETKVITNPRWLHPVKGWWSHNALVNDTFFGSEPTTNTLMTLDAEPEYADILVADWESETVILNKESSTLTLDASAFTGTSEKEIGVVDEYEKTVGTWNFK